MIRQWVLAVLFGLLSIMALEFYCRGHFRPTIDLIRDPDHRLPPSTAETNADGIRSAHEPGAFQVADLNLIFLGDSFTHGEGQPPEHALPQQLERLANENLASQRLATELLENERGATARVNVANFGWASASPLLALRQLREIGHHYAPDAVILCLDMTDFHDDLKYAYLLRRSWNLRYAPGLTTLLKRILAGGAAGNARIAHLHETVFGFPADRFFVVNHPLAETRVRCEPLLGNLDAIERFTADSLGARFLVVVLPRSFQYDARECPDNWEADAYTIMGPFSFEPFRLMEAASQERTYPIDSLLEVFRTSDAFPTCMTDDPHWTERGHRVAAEGILEILRREGVLRLEPSAPVPPEPGE